jgi:Rieske Fe-S protein
VAGHEAQAYRNAGTLEEISRRQFLANATVAVGSIIGLFLAVPLAASLIPESLLDAKKAAGGVWADLPPSEFEQLASSAGTPIQIAFRFKYADSYFPPEDHAESVWGLKLTPAQEASFKAKRPDLYANPAGEINYDALVMSFVMFSPICPHLGCRYEWNRPGFPNRFFCPCHGSQFGALGNKLAGPAPRGLDPLPFREKSGAAQVTRIQYKSGQPDRVIVAYT